MHRSFLIISILFFSVINTFAQNKYDILHTTEGTKEVKIRELGEAEIKFSYPNEETIYTLNKFLVKKIQFASGREEVIEIPFKEVNGLNDSDKIYVTYNPIEVEGLFNLGDLFSKATWATVFSSMSNVKNRSLEKMKAEAAMLGANVILITDAQSRGHYYGNQFTRSQSTQNVFFGQAYTSTLQDIPALKEELIDKKVVYYQKHSLNHNDFSPEIKPVMLYDENRNIVVQVISNVTEKDGKLVVEVPGIKAKSGNLEVIRLKDGILTLMEKHKNSIYNYILLTEESDLVKTALKNAADK